MAKLFISYTGSDREWADWIYDELYAMGHKIDEYSRKNSDVKFYKWMEAAQQAADHTVCVYSEEYKNAEFSQMEFRRAVGPALKHKQNPCLIVKVRPCDVQFGYEEIAVAKVFGKFEDEARTKLREYINRFVATKPQPFESVPFNRNAFPGRVPDNLPPFLVPCPVPNTSLFGRDTILKNIETAFKQDNKYKAVVLSGSSGAGKSMIAAAYAELNKQLYRACWWIRAANKDDLKADLAMLAARLGWMEPDAGEGFREEKVVRRLKKQGRDILLIYDDAEGYRDLHEFLPRETDAHILITSSAPNWPLVGGHIPVEGWLPKDGGEFLVLRVPAEDERLIAEDLSGAMNGLPLALEMAGACCAHGRTKEPKILLADYVRQHRDKELQLFRKGGAARTEYKKHRAAAAAYQLAIEAATSCHKAAQRLLIHVALLAPGAIPLSLFVDGRTRLDKRLAELIGGSGLSKVIDALSNFGLIFRPERTIGGSVASEHIHIHRAIRAIAPAALKPKERERIRGVMIAAIEAAYPENDGQLDVSWPKARKLTTHAWELLGDRLAPPPGFELEASDLMHKMAKFCGASDEELDKAKRLIEHSLELRRKKLAEDDRRIAESLTTLALLIHAMKPNQGETRAMRDCRARDLARQAVTMCERLAGRRDDPSVGVPLINLARILRDCGGAGDLEEARRCCETALLIYPKGEPAYAMDRAFALSVLGRVLTAQKEDALDKAQLAIEEALCLYRKTFVKNHPAEAANLVNTADILMKKHEFERARAWLKEARTIYEENIGPETGGVAHCDGKLAETFIREGHKPEARPYLKRSYDLSLKVLGPDHPVTRARERQLRSLGFPV
jgi:tetratricopeptide (TPR) repeat protein